MACRGGLLCGKRMTCRAGYNLPCGGLRRPYGLRRAYDLPCGGRMACRGGLPRWPAVRWAARESLRGPLVNACEVLLSRLYRRNVTAFEQAPNRARDIQLVAVDQVGDVANAASAVQQQEDHAVAPLHLAHDVRLCRPGQRPEDGVDPLLRHLSCPIGEPGRVLQPRPWPRLQRGRMHDRFRGDLCWSDKRDGRNIRNGGEDRRRGYRF